MKKIILEAIKNKHFYLLPNVISLFRLLLSIPLTLSLYYHHKLVALVFIILGLASDALDGFFARRNNQVTELGKILDPLADKINIAAGSIVLVLQYHFPLWLAFTIIARDIIILSGSIYISRFLNYVPPSNVTGKIAVNMIALDLLAHFLEIKIILPVLNGLALFFIVMSLYHYGTFFVKTLKSGISKNET